MGSSSYNDQTTTTAPTEATPVTTDTAPTEAPAEEQAPTA